MTRFWTMEYSEFAQLDPKTGVESHYRNVQEVVLRTRGAWIRLMKLEQEAGEAIQFVVPPADQTLAGFAAEFLGVYEYDSKHRLMTPANRCRMPDSWHPMIQL